MKIAIVGYGIVGKSTELLFSSDDVEVLVHDPDLGYEIDSWSGVEYTFICVPTPINELKKDSLSKSIVADAIRMVRGKTSSAKRGGHIVIRSTLGPDQMFEDTIYMPEFLRENSWREDTLSMNNPVVFGSHVKGVAIGKLEMYLPFTKTVYIVSPQEAALYKMSRNAFLATKVMFANHLWNLSSKYDCNYTELRRMFMNESEFGFTHWDVPGPDGKFGFGGKCLPKDTTHFANLISEENMFSQILKDNDKAR